MDIVILCIVAVFKSIFCFMSNFIFELNQQDAKTQFETIVRLVVCLLVCLLVLVLVCLL